MAPLARSSFDSASVLRSSRTGPCARTKRSMSDEGAFSGFPAVGKATAVPHAFFSRVLPEMRTPAEALAFLWAARVLQERRGDERFVSAADLWALSPAARSFDRLAGGRRNMELGLDACVAGG